MTEVGIVTGGGRGMGFACAQRIAAMVDVLLLVDLDAPGVVAAAERLTGENHRARIEPVAMDITDSEALDRLAARARESGTLRAVAHAAGISPSMADWRRIFTVDLVGTALVAQALRPLCGPTTATVCFASMVPFLDPTVPDPAALAVLDDPLGEKFLDRMHDVVGEALEDTGVAYSWAKRGVHRFVHREAVRLGPTGARICSVSPGIIDTPQSRQEAQEHRSIAALIEATPLRRQGVVDEVAAVVAFALSSEASFLNGIDLLIDGGVYAALRSRAR